MASYAKGATAERDLCKRLRSEGWWACRTAGSHGSFDIIAAKRGRPLRMLQLKRGGKSPFAGFGPRDREAAIFDARVAGGNAELVWWPDRAEPQFIPVQDWPPTRGLTPGPR